MSTVLAWLGLVVGLGVLAVVGDLFYRVVRPLREIQRNVDDTLEAAHGIERNLEGADELARTRELATGLPDDVRRVTGGGVQR